jgi:hypothetical protein
LIPEHDQEGKALLNVKLKLIACKKMMASAKKGQHPWKTKVGWIARALLKERSEAPLLERFIARRGK